MSTHKSTSTIFRLACLALCLAAAALLTSCESTQTPVFCISLHKVVQPRAFAPETLLIMPVSTVTQKRDVTITKFPVLTSANFGDVQLVDGNNGKWGLRLQLDNRGKNLWREANVEHLGLTFAIVVDGFLVDTTEFQGDLGDGFITLPPLWSKAEANMIAEHVVSNYKILNHLNWL